MLQGKTLIIDGVHLDHHFNEKLMKKYGR